MPNDEIVRAGLSSSYNIWNFIAWAAPVLTAIALYQVNFGLPRKAAAIVGEVETRLAAQTPASWPEWMLVKHGWRELGETVNVPKVPNVRVFYRTGDSTAKSSTTDILLKQGDRSVALARTIALGEEWSWPFEAAGASIEDGSTRTGLSAVLAETQLLEFVVANSGYPIDVVGVGLESSFGGDPNDSLRQLSDRRGASIARAASELITHHPTDQEIAFRTLGLGRALTMVARKNSAEERRQRAVLLLAFARMSNDIVAASVAQTTIAMAANSAKLKVTRVDLSDYEYSYAAADRLSSPLTWAGDGKKRALPNLTVDQALAMRPSAKK